MVRSGRFLLIGGVFTLFAAAMVALLVVVLASPGQSIDNPDGFTGSGRALTAAGCALAALALGVYGVSGLRVALIVDETGLVIRNPWRTTKVAWATKPKFEVRNRQQQVTVASAATPTGPGVEGDVTYRYRELVCVIGRKHVWIAATSRMRHGDRADQLLNELRQAGGRARRAPAASAEPRTAAS